MAIGSWTPGIGDPSFMGWFTVASYYLAALLCLLKLISVFSEREGRLFWAIIVLGMAALGVIKQFNLLSAATEAGRIMARSGGWAEERRLVQACAMAVLFGLFVLVLRIVRSLSRAKGARYSATISGCAYLILFVAVRAISWHPFEVLLGYEIFGVRINWIAELLGIYWVLASSLPRAAKRGPIGA